MRRFALTLLLVACSSNEPGGSGSGGSGGSGQPLVSGLNVTGLSLYQAVEVPLSPGKGAASRPAPIVVGRPALARISVQPEPGWEPRPVRARLELGGASGAPAVFEVESTVDGPSWRPDLGSTLNVELPGDAIQLELSIAVALEETDGVEHGPAASGARFPMDGPMPLEAETSGPLRVVIVPVQYDADGSGRLPELGEEQLARYRDTVGGMFPSADLSLRVRAPMPWSTPILAHGAGWNELLQGVLSLRSKDRLEGAAAPDEYYFALVAPSSSFASYCTDGCDLGQSFVAELDEEYLRGSVGLGFAGQDSADTFAHELGHTHGRLHSPCGTLGDDGDPSFPDPAGGIGAWGYDPATAELLDPDEVRDFMGYCSPVWISAYNYRALFERIGQVGAEGASSAGSSPQAYRMLSIDRTGAAALGPVLWANRPLGGKSLIMAMLDGRGAHRRWQEARMYRYSHDSGGLVLVPEPRAGDQALRWGDQTLNLR